MFFVEPKALLAAVDYFRGLKAKYYREEVMQSY